ncbi:hypothetical protein [Streptomyces sp. NPDC007063]|uniref:hypothetical protein n=1 Tax=Streptomyces sp. NPDC007063 TaxID=3364772 RepID=UPI0036AEC97B
MRAMVATVVVWLLSLAEFFVSWAVAAGLASFLFDRGVGFLPAFLLATGAGVVALFVADEFVWPGRSRSLADVAAEWADRVADWGGLDWIDADPSEQQPSRSHPQD